MSEFFLELFSEEIPSRLQINARNDLTQILKKFFDDNEIIIKGKINTYSTPNRLIVHINNISKDVIKKAEEIRGPNINAPEKALEGFLKSNKIMGIQGDGGQHQLAIFFLDFILSKIYRSEVQNNMWVQ